ncbi:hypothetical protein A4X13_0g9489 [Tilletia indica]|uniref:Uncharacterized protein n=1 Tax=Tilletia indica TaxID=43049 RepID=A0A8T8S998_9BASI|nr:hypothetical protein A4X13_0g9489 [Tilletia indica]
MRLVTLPFLAAVFAAFVSSSKAWQAPVNTPAWHDCLANIPNLCPGVRVDKQDVMKKPEQPGGPAAFYKCLHGHWEDLSNNANCPHPNVGCHCYNGCVKEMWKSEAGIVDYFGNPGDVGGSCRSWCALGAPALKCR